MNVLSISNLSVSFQTDAGRIRVVDDLSLSINAGEMVGLVGESGCGKSVTAMSIVRLLPTPPSYLDSGSIILQDKELSQLDESELRHIRGDRVGIIFQEPMTSLNPTFTIGYQLIEALRLHRPVDTNTARRKALEVLDRVGVDAARSRLKQYPHELSGGLRQRVMIAMALMCDPVLLVADEPTTALDVTIQAQVLELLESLRQELGMAILMITHDLGVVAEYCQRVVVMYSGRVVETADVEPLFATPKHPYTRGLINSIPKLELSVSELPTIPGVVPTANARPGGCYFSTRCERVITQCQNKPEMQILPSSKSRNQHPHSYACWNPVP